MITRRSLFVGGAALLSAPAIIRVADLMPVKVMRTPMIRVSMAGWRIEESADRVEWRAVDHDRLGAVVGGEIPGVGQRYFRVFWQGADAPMAISCPQELTSGGERGMAAGS